MCWHHIVTIFVCFHCNVRIWLVCATNTFWLSMLIDCWTGVLRNKIIAQTAVYIIQCCNYTITNRLWIPPWFGLLVFYLLHFQNIIFAIASISKFNLLNLSKNSHPYCAIDTLNPSHSVAVPKRKPETLHLHTTWQLRLCPSLSSIFSWNYQFFIHMSPWKKRRLDLQIQDLNAGTYKLKTSENDFCSSETWMRRRFQRTQ